MKTIKLWLTAIAALLCSLTANAEDFSLGGIYYNITSSTDLTVEVTYRGSHPNSYPNEYSGAVTIPSTVTYNNKTYRVTSIGGSAFEYCSSLTSITLPESVTSIGSYAFSGCSSLTAVHIKDITSWCNIDFGGTYSNPLYHAKNLYLNSELVTELTIPNTVTAIKDYAFDNCISLTSITIPESVTSIGYSAFEGCSSLTSITLPEGVTSIGYYAFYGCSSLTSIPSPRA